MEPEILPQDVQGRDYILQQINLMLSSIVDSIRNHSPLEVRLKNRFSPNKTTKLSFPGQIATQAWRFVAFVKLLEIVHGCVSERKLVTKRDIYYQNVNLFRKQIVVDRLVDDLAATLHVKRSLLNVVAAAKGLVCGRLVIRLQNGHQVDCEAKTGETLVPLRTNIQDVTIAESVKYILVVEKEAIFRSLLSDASDEFKREFVVLTGKGYPDISTREFISFLSNSTYIPIYGLMDYDPHGIQIGNIYQHGSASLGHQGPSIICARMGRLGVTATDMKKVLCAGAAEGGLEGLICLSSRDRRKAHELLVSTRQEGVARQELQFMLFLGYKAEIEILDGSKGSLESWLRDKLN